MFWVNQLMGFSFALFSSCNKGPFDNLRISLWKIKRTFAEYFWMTFGCHNFTFNQPLSSGSLLA